MNKLRVSYSTLKLWQQGRIDDMLISYFRIGQIHNPYLQQGKEWDEYVNNYVREHGKLPPEFGGRQLVKPTPQEKWVVSYNERFDLVGVVDVLDTPTLYEIKTGTSKDSGDYCNEFQVAMYFLMAEMQDINIEKGVIIHYEQYKKQFDQSIIWNLPFERNRARNYIDTLAPEIYTYFEQNDLFNRQRNEASA